MQARPLIDVNGRRIKCPVCKGILDINMAEQKDAHIGKFNAWAEYRVGCENGHEIKVDAFMQPIELKVYAPDETYTYHEYRKKELEQ